MIWCRRGSRARACARYRSGSGDKKTSGVADENRLNDFHDSKYRISLDHQILTEHGVFYPYALENHPSFELTLAPASQVVRGSDSTKLKYRLTNIQLESELMYSLYASGTEFVYDMVTFDTMEPISRGKGPAEKHQNQHPEAVAESHPPSVH